MLDGGNHMHAHTTGRLSRAVRELRCVAWRGERAKHVRVFFGLDQAQYVLSGPAHLCM